MDSVLSHDSGNDEKEVKRFTEQCKLLQMLAIPTFGQFRQNEEYIFPEQLLVLETDTRPDNLPEKLSSKLDSLKGGRPGLNINYFHVTLSTSNLLSPTSEKEVNSSYTLLNLIAHPYIFYDCRFTQNIKHKTSIFCSVFTDDLESDTIKYEEHQPGQININPDCNLDSKNLERDIILELGDDGVTSLSPNNCGILMNLNAQIIHFYLVVLGTYVGQIVKCFVGNFVLIPNASNSPLFGDLYNRLVKENNKEQLTTEVILFRNKYNDYLNYIFSFGVNEIVSHAKNLDQIKLCIKKAFSLIYDFSINGNENDKKNKKIHEKELENMTNNYYDSLCNYIKNLYQHSEFDPKFGEKMLENSLKNNYIEELLLKYAQYCKKRLNQMISNYEFFLYENDDALNNIEQNADDNYSENILPNLKSLFADLLNSDEEKVEEIKDTYSEENRIHKNNPNIETLINICNAVRNGDNIAPVLNELDDLMKIYLFYIVWIYKGKPMGIDDDFGRVSFMNEKIDKKYYCNSDDRINCCQQLIEYLEKADDQI